MVKRETILLKEQLLLRQRAKVHSQMFKLNAEGPVKNAIELAALDNFN